MPARTLPPPRPARLKSIDRTHELAWITRHRGEYQGEWVVLDGNRLIGHGVDPGPLVERARSQGVERPLVTRIEEEPIAFTGGWLYRLAISQSIRSLILCLKSGPNSAGS